MYLIEFDFQHNRDIDRKRKYKNRELLASLHYLHIYRYRQLEIVRYRDTIRHIDIHKGLEK